MPDPLSTGGSFCLDSGFIAFNPENLWGVYDEVVGDAESNRTRSPATSFMSQVILRYAREKIDMLCFPAHSAHVL